MKFVFFFVNFFNLVSVYMAFVVYLASIKLIVSLRTIHSCHNILCSYSLSQSFIGLIHLTFRCSCNFGCTLFILIHALYYFCFTHLTFFFFFCSEILKGVVIYPFPPTISNFNWCIVKCYQLPCSYFS